MTLSSADLRFGDVSVGERPPEIVKEVSTTTVVLGALSTRDWRPMHHDRDFAVHQNGADDIFMNTPTIAAWLERAVTDWTGPKGRLGRLRFAIQDSIYPGQTMAISGEVRHLSVDAAGCGWALLQLTIKQRDRLCVSATARVALPLDGDDNPWTRRGPCWIPDEEHPDGP